MNQDEWLKQEAGTAVDRAQGQEVGRGPHIRYQSSNGIGWAVRNMYQGVPVRRRGWNGRGMNIQIQMPDVGSKMNQPYVYIKTVQGHLIPWLCSQADLLAADWEAATVDE